MSCASDHAKSGRRPRQEKQRLEEERRAEAARLEEERKQKEKEPESTDQSFVGVRLAAMDKTRASR